jgi:hypothetical protein
MAGSIWCTSAHARANGSVSAQRASGGSTGGSTGGARVVQRPCNAHRQME